jgi:hypothetical protein
MLHTRGRVSGATVATPVAVVRWGGRRWLVSPFGDVGWVRNARVDGRAHVSRGRWGRLDITLHEVHGTERPIVQRRFRARFRFIPFVRAAFVARPADGLERFASEADDHPVFEIRVPSSAPTSLPDQQEIHQP